MKVESLVGHASFPADGVSYHHIDAVFVTENLDDATKTSFYLQEAYRHNKDICFGSSIPTPEKIFRCGNATTVIWKDGTKTTVKLIPGAEDSDYGAFTAALAKKIYGGNGKVMKYAGMVQRVKSKAEKKATRKLKRKYEEKITGEKKYIVSQYGQVAECKGIETDSMGVGEKVIVFANDEGEARHKAVDVFRRSSLLKEWLVLGNGSVCEVVLLNAADSADGCFGIWTQSCIDKNYFKTCVFAKDKEEAKKALAIIHAPDPIPF